MPGRVLAPVLVAAAALAAVPGCRPAARPLTVGVSFETLQTEYWVASFETLKAELAARDIRVLTAVADGDPSRQLEQVNGFLVRGVDGVIIAPKDGATVLPVIKAANAAGVPI